MNPHQRKTSRSSESLTGSSSLSAGQGGFAGGALPRAAGGVDFRALRNATSIAAVLDLIGWEAVSRAGMQLRGPCPVHKSSSERSRSFSVNLELNVFQCFGCGKKGNHLDLWSAVRGGSLHDAAIDLAERLGVSWEQITKRPGRHP